MRMGGNDSPKRVGVHEPVGVTGVARLEPSLSPSMKWKRCRWNCIMGISDRSGWDIDINLT